MRNSSNLTCNCSTPNIFFDIIFVSGEVFEQPGSVPSNRIIVPISYRSEHKGVVFATNGKNVKQFKAVTDKLI
jgi:hypothetical protein